MKISEEIEVKIKKVDTQLKLLWIGNLLSFGMYVFIAYKAVEQQEVSSEKEVNLSFILIISFVSLSALVISFIYRHYFLSTNAIRKILRDGIPWFFKIGLNESLRKEKKIIDLTEGEGKLLWYISHFINFQMIHWGIGNSCALMGLMGAVINGLPVLIYPFICCSCIVMFSQFPKLGTLVESALKSKELSHYKEI